MREREREEKLSFSSAVCDACAGCATSASYRLISTAQTLFAGISPDTYRCVPRAAAHKCVPPTWETAKESHIHLRRGYRYTVDAYTGETWTCDVYPLPEDRYLDVGLF